MKILVLNCGSSSLKFQLIDIENEEILAKGNFERIGGMKTTLKLNVRGEKSEILRIARDYDEAIAYVLKVLQKPEYNILSSLDEIGGVGHRIVHGGEMFNSSVLIDEDVISEIEKCIALAPLHNPASVAGIRAAQRALPGVPMVAVFDTAFHQTMPPKAYIYQIPYRYYTTYKIRKYGFCDTILIDKFLGREHAILIQNAFPTLEKYIDHEHVFNGIPAKVPETIQKKILENFKKMMKLKKKGINLFFPDIDKIKKMMLEELSKDKELIGM